MLKLEFKLEEERQNRADLERKLLSPSNLRQAGEERPCGQNFCRDFGINTAEICSKAGSDSLVERPNCHGVLQQQGLAAQDMDAFDRDSWADAPTVEVHMPGSLAHL